MILSNRIHYFIRNRNIHSANKSYLYSFTTNLNIHQEREKEKKDKYHFENRFTFVGTDGGGGGGDDDGNFGPTMMILSALALYTSQQITPSKTN